MIPLPSEEKKKGELAVGVEASVLVGRSVTAEPCAMFVASAVTVMRDSAACVTDVADVRLTAAPPGVALKANCVDVGFGVART